MPQANGNSRSEEFSVDHVVDGELEVNLDDLGISAEDIKAFRRIEARLTEAQTEGTSSSKGGTFGPSDANKGEGHGAAAVGSRSPRAVQTAEGGRASLSAGVATNTRKEEHAGADAGWVRRGA